LPRQIALGLGIKWKQNIRIKFEVADNNTSMADGITNDLKVNVGGNIHYTKFVVMDHKGNDAILGLPFFEISDGVIHPAQNKFYFEHGSAYINTNNTLVEEYFQLEATVDEDLIKNQDIRLWTIKNHTISVMRMSLQID
jgi:hypothetical protein